MQRKFYSGELRNSFRRVLSLCAAVLVAAIVAGCERPEPVIGGNDLVVTVFNPSREPISEATVTLFKTEEDFWNNTNPIMPPAKTYPNGRVFFQGIDPRIENVYVSAELGDANNLEDVRLFIRMKTSASENNEIHCYIKESVANSVAGRAGKKWKQLYYEINNTRFEGCENRRYYEFVRKNWQINVFECTDPNKGLGINKWSLSEDGKTISIGLPTASNRKSNVTFIELNESKMTFIYKAGTFTAKESYEAVK